MPDTAIPPQLSDAARIDASERARSLAARIDAMMEADDDEPVRTEAAIDLDEIEEVEEVPAIPPPRAVVRAAAPTPPPLPVRPSGVPVVVVPPRTGAPTVRGGMGLGLRPPMAPPRASTPLPAMPHPVPTPPSVAIPPLEPSRPVSNGEAHDDAGEAPVVAIPAMPVVTVPPLAAASEPGPVPDVEVSDAVVISAPIVVPPPMAPRRSAPTLPPPMLPPAAMERRGSSTMPPPLGDLGDGLMGPGDSGVLVAGGVEVSTHVANVVVTPPLDTQLETPTVLDRALDELGDAGGEKRAETMARDLESTTDGAAAAMLAYELGELYERRLADEARAVKAYGRALTLDPALRANLWAIRRVFYRRALWPNLVKLISAEVAYARDDHERADLLLERARISGEHMNDPGEARVALEEAIQIAPGHQAALLELERILARAGDAPALLDVWERLADAVEHPARKVAYWLEVARGAAATNYGRAQAAFDQAAAPPSGSRASGCAPPRPTARPTTSPPRSTRSPPSSSRRSARPVR